MGAIKSTSPRSPDKFCFALILFGRVDIPVIFCARGIRGHLATQAFLDQWWNLLSWALRGYVCLRAKLDRGGTPSATPFGSRGALRRGLPVPHSDGWLPLPGAPDRLSV